MKINSVLQVEINWTFRHNEKRDLIAIGRIGRVKVFFVAIDKKTKSCEISSPLPIKIKKRKHSLFPAAKEECLFAAKSFVKNLTGGAIEVTI